MDLAPLVELGAAGVLKHLDVEYNLLDAPTRETHIPALQGLGVGVLFHPPFPDDDDFPGSRITHIYNDNVVVIYAPTIYQFRGRELVREFYRWFEDRFDYIIFFPNTSAGWIEREAAGAFFRLVNRDLGFGRSIYNPPGYPSQKLRGTVLLENAPWRDFEERYGSYGILNHEILHTWSQFILPGDRDGHWLWDSANGIHGGFSRDQLTDLGNGRYRLETPGLNGWTGSLPSYFSRNNAHMSPIELYLAGYVGAEEVPPLLSASDVHIHSDYGGVTEFTATMREYSVEDLVAEHGPRVPSHHESQKHFRAATILLTDAEHPLDENRLEYISALVAGWSSQADNGPGINFWKATGGRGSMTTDGLSQFRRAARTRVERPPSFGQAPPPIVCRRDGSGWTHEHVHWMHRDRTAHRNRFLGQPAGVVHKRKRAD